jgi:hypothetical protein
MDEATREAIYAAMEEQAPGRQQSAKRAERLKADLEFALGRMEQWRGQYPNHWVAVYNKKVVAAELDAECLEHAILEANVPLADTYVEFVPKEKPLLML